MKTSIKLLIIFLISWFQVEAQICDGTVPSMNVDLSASPNLSWTSPLIARNGNCCGTSNPDRCLEFVITLHPDAIAINFSITSGAIPPGALFYQIDCGPVTPVGAPICLNGPGPYTLTFCKPGNNTNEYSITSYSSPIIGPDITLNSGCTDFIFANYYNEPSVTWNSIFPGAPGAYNSYLSCTNSCDTTYVTAPIGAPAYVDYLVCGNDIGGCNPNPICDTIRVNFVSPVSVSLSADNINLCAGQTTTINAVASGGSPAYSYLWNTLETTSSIIGGPGTYFVEVRDSSLCLVATDTIIINQFPIPPVNGGPDQVVCEGTAVILNGSGANIYAWDNGIINGVPFVQSVGTVIYTVIGTDINGCQNTDQVSVTVNPLPIVNAGVDQLVCEGAAVTLNGSGAVGYIWDNGVIDGVPFVQGVGTTIYTVIGTDVNGCQNTDQVDVTVNPLPIVNAGLDQVVCEGVPVTLNGSGAVIYNWDNGVVDGVPFIQSPGTITYTVVGIDAKGCQNTDQVEVTVNPLPNVNAGPDQEVCEGIAVTLSGSGAITFIWDNGIINNVPFIQEVGTTVYTVIGTDNNGCQNTDQVIVKVNPNPIIDAGSDQTLCENEWITLTGIGAPVLNWDNGVIDNVPFQQQIGSIDYTLTGVLPTGCFATDMVRVTILQNPIVTTNDVVICEGEQVILYGNGALSYSWSNGVVDGIPFYPNQSGSYIVTGTAANGCTAEAIANVTVNPAPYVDFDVLNLHLTTSDPTTGFDNLSSGAVNFEWYFSDGSPINTQFEPTHTFPEDQAGEYYIELTAYSEFGCSARAIKYVHVFRDYIIYVPNAFTPDNSGLNEVFNPEMTGFDEDGYTMYIFNRWGDLVFETHDMQVGWNGTFHNDNFQVQDGVFTWKIEARIKDSADTKIFVGHVSILK